MTAQTLINRALRSIGMLDAGAGNPPNSQETTDALVILNAMLDAWSAERLTVFTITRSVNTLSANTQSVTVGASGTWNIARPPKIESVSAIDGYGLGAGGVISGTEYPIEYTTEERRWREITVKATAAQFPSFCYDDQGFTQRTLYFYPYPSAATSICLYVWTALTSYATSGTDHTYPPGYEEAMVYNLGLRLAPEWGQRDAIVLAQVGALAEAGKNRIKAANVPMVTLDCDPAITSNDILAGFVNRAAFLAGG